jgi:hypothetical protein
MSTDFQVAERFQAEPVEEGPEQYRALCSAAVVALVFGLLSLAALMDYWLVVVPAVGIIWGIIALRQIRARAGELTGRGLAMCGLALSSVLLFAGPTWVYYDEMSQVPPGYQWISYEELQPNPNVLGEIVPKSAIDFNGKKVFIKGFVFAGSQSEGIKKFVLVRDAGTCCFGGNPKITDRIVVDLATPGGMMYTKQIARVSGVFRVTPSQAPGGIGAVYYHLDQADLR